MAVASKRGILVCFLTMYEGSEQTEIDGGYARQKDIRSLKDDLES